MKERPILFSGAMVRALLDGSKTQTRRVVKGLNHEPHAGAVTAKTDGSPLGSVCWDFGGPLIFCPYGQPGDRLWVRETWQYYGWSEDGDPQVRFAADEATTWPRVPIEKADEVENAWVSLSSAENYAIDNHARDRRWRPSIHMPRWASRILLEIVSVRVERLNDISEADAWAEGIDAVDGQLDDMAIINLAKQMDRSWEDAAPTFAALWESINGAGSWAANPWVWVIEFKRVTP